MVRHLTGLGRRPDDQRKQWRETLDPGLVPWLPQLLTTYKRYDEAFARSTEHGTLNIASGGR